MNMSNTNTRRVRLPLAALITGAALLNASGCTTTMTSEPVPPPGTSTSKPSNGIRYSLPAPHISLIPGTDGTIDVKVEYLPDPNNTYTLDVDSLFSSANLDVATKNGMLTKLILNSNSTAVAKQTIETGKVLAQEHFKTEAKRKSDEQKAAADLASAAKTAADAVTDKQQEIKLLKVERKFLKDNPAPGNDDKIRTIDLSILKAEAELRFLREKAGNAADAVASAGTSFNDGSAFMDPEPVDDGLRKAWGPVLFRVLPDGHRGVKMVAIEGQQQYLTSTEPATPAQPSPLMFRPDPVLVRASDTRQEFVVAFNKALSAIDPSRSELYLPSRSATTPVRTGNDIGVSIVSTDSQKVRVVMPSGLTAGDYLLSIVLTVQGETQTQQQDISVNWRKN